jgi:hypothetical protein
MSKERQQIGLHELLEGIPRPDHDNTIDSNTSSPWKYDRATPSSTINQL